MLGTPKELAAEVAASHVAIFVNFFFWEQPSLRAEGFDDARRDLLLSAIRQAWVRHFPRVALGITR